MNCERKRLGLIGGLVLTGAIGLSALASSSAFATEKHNPFKPPLPTPSGSKAPEQLVPIPCPSNLPWSGASQRREPEGFRPDAEFASIKFPQPTKGTDIYCDWWKIVPVAPEG
jgi:hypothetical protein